MRSPLWKWFWGILGCFAQEIGSGNLESAVTQTLHALPLYGNQVTVGVFADLGGVTKCIYMFVVGTFDTEVEFTLWKDVGNLGVTLSTSGLPMLRERKTNKKKLEKNITLSTILTSTKLRRSSCEVIDLSIGTRTNYNKTKQHKKTIGDYTT